jgi:hemolysin activation/secretion protein
VLLDRPQGLRVTTVLNGEAGTGTFQYARASVEGTITRPVSRFSTALTGAIGSSVGDVPRQRGWFVGGVRTVRGQIAGTQDGDAFWLARAEVGTKQGVFRPVGFFDVGSAGSRNAFGKLKPQRGAGVGIGVLDGLIRVDFSRGLYPLKQWRTDFYLSAAL